jgi:lipoate-protein ligase A
MGSESWRLLDYSLDSVFQNLAIEEALARSADFRNLDQTIRLWNNPTSVILGRFQYAPAEVDISLCQQSGIQIARRFTGGGAVFQDEGNLNLTILVTPDIDTPLTKLNEISSAIILNALDGLGLKGSILPPNSIMVGEKKVSGAAGAMGKRFALWHSSIMVSTNIEQLESALAPSRETKTSHYVHSRWRPVTNLQTSLNRPLDVTEVKSRLIESTEKILGVQLQRDRLRSEEEDLSRRLLSQKYSLPDWNLKGTH